MIDWEAKYDQQVAETNRLRDELSQACTPAPPASPCCVRMPAEPSQALIDRMTASLNYDGLPPAEALNDADYDHDMTKAYRALYAALAAGQQSAASSATDLLAWLRDETNLELSFERWEEDGRWQVHGVWGGRNDQEWSLLGRGDTPEQALSAAKIALDIRKGAKATSRARNDRQTGEPRS